MADAKRRRRANPALGSSYETNLSASVSRRTRQTVQFKADVCHSTFARCCPMAVGPRWITPDVLPMPALQFGNPI